VVESGIVDREPLEITSPAGPREIFPIGSVRAMLLHAPGELVLAVPRGASGFAGAFGIRDGAFDGAGRTEGVRFVLEGIWADGHRRELWSRSLDPLRTPSDRGAQRLECPLPEEAPERLSLRTLPRSGSDNRWGWSYVSGLRFLPSATP